MDSDLKDLDLYGILEIQQSATEKEIKTAYRKKALQCHPDKNPDNPKAAQLFLQLSKILTILTDTAARLAYDKLVNAKIAAKLREKEYDSKRKKLIDDLVKRENAALGKQKDTVERNFEKELERLRKESSSLLAKERARVNELLKQQESEKEKIGSFKLKVKWKENGVYNKENLTSLFSKHGDVITVVVLENKKCVALVEYKSKTSAINAKNLEVGYPNSPLIVSFLGDYGQDIKKSSTHTSAQNPSNIFSAYQNQNVNHTENTSKTTSSAQAFLDYEAMILERFRQAGKPQQENSNSNIINTEEPRMPGTRCAVAICQNSLQATKKKNLNISYHTFPKDPKLCNAWINACRRKDEWNPKTSTICSVHFLEDQFEVDLRSQLMNIKTKQKLKTSAVPTQNLKENSLSNISTDLTSRQVRANKRHNATIVKNLMHPTENNDNAQGDDDLTHEDQDKLYGVSPALIDESIEEKYQKLLNEHTKLKTKYKHLLQFKRVQKHRILTLNKNVNTLSQKFGECVLQTQCLKESLNTVFSDTQLQLITKRKKKVVWGTEDISRAFTLRYLSKRCYIYLRNTLKYPLPHVSTLVKWASRLSFRQGFLNDVIRIMKIAALNLNDIEKLCVIQFDEMKILSAYEYDKKNDQVIGPHSQMQVIMVRGIFKRWKQPIYVNFDQQVTPEILNEAISILYENAYTVVACVSDCGGSNVGLWKKLDITIDKTFFLHPITKEKIYFLADAPHLLKLIRNWMLDTGFILSDGSRINSGPLKELLKVTRTEISVCHKLTQKHLDCIKSERQNVGLAAQLLSHSVATALIHYKPGPDKVVSENTGQFIETISNWFDIMNSYTPSETLCTKKPYGLNLEDQNNCLEKVYKLINSMRCQGKNVLQTFQKGILISIKSTQELFKHLNKKYNISYILTHRLNQDSLENFFSLIRSRGGLNDHPTPLNALYRIRIIVLGKNPGVVQAKQNIETQNYQSSSEEYLVANVMATADVKIDLNNDKNNGELSDSSLSSEDESAQKNLQTTNEEDGFIYLCGWLARKFKNKYLHLGSYTKDKKLEHSYSMPSWVHHLSFGGLTEPTDYWVMQAKQFENIFKKFHKEKVDPNSNIVKRLSNLIKKKFCDMPEDLIKAFVLQRTYIRIKQLNDDLMTEQLKRKRSLTSDRKYIKKMKKIIT